MLLADSTALLAVPASEIVAGAFAMTTDARLWWPQKALVKGRCKRFSHPRPGPPPRLRGDRAMP